MVSHTDHGVPLSRRVWRFVYWTWRGWRDSRRTPMQRRLAPLLARQDHECPAFSTVVEPIAKKVRAEASSINGDLWNYYSGSLTPSNVSVFERAVAALTPASDEASYLEIGSASGITMAMIGSLLQRRFSSVRLVSVDPYYSGGYAEGLRGPGERELPVNIDKGTRDRARALYDRFGLDVELVELPSTRGLCELIANRRWFDLIYIDGLHEGLQPAIDFGLCVPLLHPGGIVMLDDHFEWADVTPLKKLCDLHAVKIAENLKIAAYRLPS